MAKKKQKVVVWMSRKRAGYSYKFWKIKPRWSKIGGWLRGGDYVTGKKPKCVACGAYVNRVLYPLGIKGKGLIKLTITAERIE